MPVPRIAAPLVRAATAAAVLAAVAAVTAVGMATAHADVDIARADALFAEAQALKETNLLQACAKFDESFALNPQAIGTLMNVALCDEKLGRIASAITHFSEARDRAIEASLPDYQTAAEQHIAALAPDLSHLALELAEPALPGLRVLVDDRVVPLAALTALPIDPGERVIAVSAPGRVTFETKLVITKRETEHLRVPPLRRAVIVSGARRSIGRLAVAGGVAALGTGIVVGFVANARFEKQFDRGACMEAVGDMRPLCTPEGQKAASSARTLGTVGTVVGAVGVGAVIVGTVLWLTAPSPGAAPRRAEHARLVPVLTRDSAGLAASGHF